MTDKTSEPIRGKGGWGGGGWAEKKAEQIRLTIVTSEPAEGGEGRGEAGGEAPPGGFA